MDEFPYQIVLFDLDGTLIDTQVGIISGLKYAFCRLGLETPSSGKLKSLIGPPLHEVFRLALPASALSEITNAVSFYREYYGDQGVFEFTLYPNILETLETLHKNKKTLSVATLKPTKYAEKMLSHARIRDYFQIVEGTATDHSAPSDKVALIHGTLSKLKLKLKLNLNSPSSRQSPIQSLMVGDRYHDIHGAMANQLDSAWVSYGYGTPEDLALYQPTHILHAIQDLLELKK